MPPTVALPMAMPWPCRKSQSVTVMFSQPNPRPADFFTRLDGDVVVTSVDGAMGDGHVAAIDGVDRRRYWPHRPVPGSVTSSITTSSQSVRTKWDLGELINFTPAMWTFLQWLSMTRSGRGSGGLPGFPGTGFLGRPPPVRAIAVNCSLAGNGDVREVFPADERDELVVAPGRQPVAATLEKIRLCRRGQQRGACFEQ